MSWLSGILKRWNVISHFTRDDVFNAEAEDALRTQKRAVEDARSAFDTLHEKGVNLRSVMQDARLRVADFAQFEQRIRNVTKRR
jgi:hypothetical protein